MSRYSAIDYENALSPQAKFIIKASVFGFFLAIAAFIYWVDNVHKTACIIFKPASVYCTAINEPATQKFHLVRRVSESDESWGTTSVKPSSVFVTDQGIMIGFWRKKLYPYTSIVVAKSPVEITGTDNRAIEVDLTSGYRYAFVFRNNEDLRAFVTTLQEHQVPIDNTYLQKTLSN